MRYCTYMQFGLGLFLMLYIKWINKGECKTVQCRHRKLRNDTKYLGNRKECYCYIETYQWSEKQVKPAPKPNGIQLNQSTFTTKNKTRISVKISWQQKGSDIQYIDPGYHIEVVNPINEHWGYNCIIKRNSLKDKDTITFQYNFKAGENKSRILPGNKFFITVLGYPGYNKDDNPSYVNSDIQIGDCSNRLINNTEFCKKKQQQQHKDRIRRKKQSEINEEKNKNVEHGTQIFVHTDSKDYIPTLYMTLGGVFAFLAFIAILSIVVYRTNRTIHGEGINSTPKVRHILVIGDYSEKYASFINRLIEFLNQDNVSIHSNIRQATEVARDGIIRWTTEKLDMVDVAILVINNQNQLVNTHVMVTDGDEENQICSHVGVAIKIAENVALKKGFKYSRKKFIAMDLNESIKENLLVSCKVYDLKLKQGFKKTFIHALGPYFKNENSKQVIEVLSKILEKATNCEMESCSTRPKDKLKHWVKCSNIVNNLDESNSYECCELTPLNSLNIPAESLPEENQRQLPSIECNVDK